MCRKYSCTCSFLPACAGSMLPTRAGIFSAHTKFLPARAGNIPAYMSFLPACAGNVPAHIYFLYACAGSIPAHVYCMCRKVSCMSLPLSAWVCREYTCTYLLPSCTHPFLPTCVGTFSYTHLFLPPCVEACLHKCIPAHE